MSKILIIWNKEDNNQDLANLLTDIGYDITVVFNEEEAFKATNELSPDIALVDTSCPEINISNICKKLNFKCQEESKSNREYLYEDILAGYPMQEMTSEIAKKDKDVSAFLIAIAKKESNWGKHSPQKNGKSCYNYWGYRGSYNATDSGYSCFDNPTQAISVVGGRIEDLINQTIDTPEKMVVWKCGRSCSWDNPTAVKKWISDVSLYYHKINS